MSANRIPKYFPYKNLRPGQLTLIDAIGKEFSKGVHLCVEAANGFGKTIAALTGVLPLAKQQQFGIFYVARTHKQMDRVMQELRPISDAFGFKGIVFRGRAASCLNPLVKEFAPSSPMAMYICSQLKRTDRCSYFQVLQKKLKRSRGFLQQFIDTPLTGQQFLNKCEKEQVCPYELAKQLLPLATVIATTYHSIFDPQVNSLLFEAYGRPLSQTLLILDEAHNLPRISVEIASARLSIYSVRQARREANRFGFPSVVAYCRLLEDLIQNMLEDQSETEKKIENKAFNTKLIRKLKIRDVKVFSTELQLIGDKIVEKLLAEDKSPISYIHFLARFFEKWCMLFQRSDVALFLIKNGSKARSAQLEIIAMDPRRTTVPVLNRCHASVHLSGTLQPFDAHIDLVGLPQNSRVLSLPSPFNRNQIFPVISLGVVTSMKHRTPYMFEKINKRIDEICRATPHNVGVFVPSYSVLQSLLKAGIETLLNRKLFVEKQGGIRSLGGTK
jgi:DNA excision repair protein ERCC-2